MYFYMMLNHKKNRFEKFLYFFGLVAIVSELASYYYTFRSLYKLADFKWKWTHKNENIWRNFAGQSKEVEKSP